MNVENNSGSDRVPSKKAAISNDAKGLTREVTEWAMIDSQPHHHKSLNSIDFSIIIDHHLADPLL